jgi:chemotaxis protein MotB
MRSITITALLGLAMLVATGCANKAAGTQANPLTDENQQLKTQVSQLQSQLAAAQAAQSALAARDAKIKELEAKLQQPQQIAGLETTYDAAKGELTVNVPGDVLFDSGRDALKPASLKTLDNVIAALKKDYAGKKIRVEGHTDTDPIRNAKGQFSDNLDLSLNRAAAVSRYLIKHGIPAKEIATVGFGETRPKATKDKSRRVEIVVVVR